jgi:ribosomal protein S18 acetylase RimI-like enzyme
MIVDADRAGLAQEELIERALPWLVAASEPYLSFLCGDFIEPAQLLRRLAAMPGSEYWLGGARLLVEESGAPAGGYIAMPGVAVAGRRQHDFGMFLRLFPRQAFAHLREAVAAAATLFAPVDAEAWYLSKIGVLPGRAGQGYGRALLRDCLQQAAANGHRRCRLDVAGDNEAAAALYCEAGFHCMHEGASPGGGLRYRGMSLELGESKND